MSRVNLTTCTGSSDRWEQAYGQVVSTSNSTFIFFHSRLSPCPSAPICSPYSLLYLCQMPQIDVRCSVLAAIAAKGLLDSSKPSSALYVIIDLASYEAAASRSCIYPSSPVHSLQTTTLTMLNRDEGKLLTCYVSCSTLAIALLMELYLGFKLCFRHT